MRDDAEIGRIDISGSPKRDGEARIFLREHSFECRIHITGKAPWTYVPSRWVMYSGVTALHGATWESGKTFLTEDEAGQEPVRLRRDNFSGSCAVERASDQRRIGEIRYVSARLLPKPVGLRIVSDINLALQETFEALLLYLRPVQLQQLRLNRARSRQRSPRPTPPCRYGLSAAGFPYARSRRSNAVSISSIDRPLVSNARNQNEHAAIRYQNER